MSENKTSEFPLEKQNLILIAAGVAVVIIGFFLMSGGGAADETTFSADVFSARRMYAAPIVILSGYALVMFGIMKK